MTMVAHAAAVVIRPAGTKSFKMEREGGVSEAVSGVACKTEDKDKKVTMMNRIIVQEPVD